MIVWMMIVQVKAQERERINNVIILLFEKVDVVRVLVSNIKKQKEHVNLKATYLLTDRKSCQDSIRLT